jgi:hypothetical protein
MRGLATSTTMNVVMGWAILAHPPNITLSFSVRLFQAKHHEPK